MHRSVFSLFFRLSAFVRPLLPTMFFSISMGVVGHLSAIAVMTLSAVFIAKVMGLAIPCSFTCISIVLFIAGLVRGVFHYLEQYAGHDVAFRLLKKIRSDLFETLRRLAPAKLADKKSGDLVTSLTADIEIIEVFFAHTVAPVVIAAVLFVVLTVFFFFLHPVFAAIMAVSYLIIAAVLPALKFKHAQISGAHHRERLSGLNSAMIDSLQGMRELILFGKARQRINTLVKKTEALHDVSKMLRVHEGTMIGLTEIIITLTSLAVLLAGFVLVRGTVSPHVVLIAFITAVSSFGAFVALNALSTVIVHTFAAADRIFALEDEVPPVKDAPDAQSFTSGSENPSIRYDQVSFGYEKGCEVISDFSQTIPSGTHIALTGESGSGKTTLLRLLLRFWDPDTGEIRMDGDCIMDVTLYSLRENIATVAQETYLFNTTIAENIRLGNADATDEEVTDAAKKAEIHNVIETFPDGYNTYIGELGNRLSGGERQRLGIARAILKQSGVVLLDEMTSNLDVLSEKALLRTIVDTMKKKTVITVSHRDTVTRIADIIITLKPS